MDRWETHWADTRIYGTTKRQVAVMFAEEQPALGPLPLEPFRYYRDGERTVHLDGCVQMQRNDLHVRLLAPQTGQLLRERLRAPRGWHRLHDDDRPARTPSSTVALLRDDRWSAHPCGGDRHSPLRPTAAETPCDGRARDRAAANTPPHAAGACAESEQ